MQPQLKRPPRRALLLFGLAAAGAASCGQVGGGGSKPKPAPPPPSETVPNAPGPDNTIKEMPANPAPPEKSRPEAEPAKPEPTDGGSGR